MVNEKKVIFLTYIPSPYRVDFFNELNKFCDLYVVYYEKGANNLGWKETQKVHTYKHTILFEKSKLLGILNLFKLLISERKNIFVIGGYAMLPEILAILFLKIIGVKFVINSDGGFITKGFLKTLIKKVLIQSASYWLSSGVNTTKTLQYYGAKISNIFEYNFTSLMQEDVMKEVLTIDEKNQLKHKLNLKIGTSYIIYVGRLIQLKGVDVLINAISEIKTKNIELLLIGDGEEKVNLDRLINEKGLFNIVRFLGKKSKNDVLKYLKASDLFVLPSRGVGDVWGLVINEAIANGLAIISTKKVGASYSLIKEGLNGYIINCDNEIELSHAIEKVYAGNLFEQQKISLNIAQDYTIENMAKAHLKLFNKLNANTRH